MKACMESVLKHKGALSSGELWMLTVMVYAHDENHHLAASHQQIADMAGMGLRNSKRLTLMLREKGLIRLVSEDGGKNVYALPCAAPEEEEPFGPPNKTASPEAIREYIEHIGLEETARDAKAKIVNIGDIDL